MTLPHFDRIGTLLTGRKLSRRRALATGGAGLAAAGLAVTGLGSVTAQDATPEPDTGTSTSTSERPVFLFVQSFQSGSIAPTEGAAGRYTVTLDHGLGQTIYFGDRPSREVGALPTPRFLEELGFPDDNPPNAALLVETAPGETDIAVVELFNPTFDPAGPNVTYEVAVLENWQDDVALGFQAAPADLAALAPEFGTAHLLIDDCSDRAIDCCTDVSCGEDGCTCGNQVAAIGPVGFCWKVGDFCCEPCAGSADAYTQQCNADYSGCGGECTALTAPGCW